MYQNELKYRNLGESSIHPQETSLPSHMVKSTDILHKQICLEQVHRFLVLGEYLKQG